MRTIFADTSYWVAITNPRDALHRRATELPEQLGEHQLVTSEMVLVEAVNAFSGSGVFFREAVVGLVQRIIDNPHAELVPQTPELFRDALALYRGRFDKRWSLTDCASFVIMDRHRIVDALTADRHFEQSGYRPQLRG